MKNKGQLKYLTLLSLCYLFHFVTSAKTASEIPDLEIGGLKFKSQDVYASDRTSLSLFPKGVSISNDITVSFDFEIYDFTRFGYILRLIDQKPEGNPIALQLIYNPGAAENDTANIELYSPSNQKSLFFLIPKNQQTYKFSFTFKKKRQALIVSCNSETKELDDIQLSGDSHNLVFGLWGQNKDVAAMQIRNVRYQENDKTKFFWLLDEFEGDKAYEIVNGILSTVKNPIWLRNEHFHWDQHIRFKSDEMVGVVYNEKQNSFYFINKDSMLRYNCATRILDSLGYRNKRPFSENEHFSLYNKIDDQIISYDFKFLNSKSGTKAYSVLDLKNMTWSLPDDVIETQELHHHGTYWTDNKQLTVFGGYGHFKYFNSFRRYDFVSNSWSSLEFTGDKIFPRTHSVLARSEDSNSLYIYGGFGNEEGQQVVGGKIFYDLYKVDLSTREITQVMDVDKSEYDFVPRGHLIINKNEEDFYTLGSKMINKANLSLFHINPANGTIEPISDSIPIVFNNMAADAFLYRNKINQELFCVVRESGPDQTSIISIHRLKFPPSKLVKRESHKSSLPFGMLIILFILIVAISIGWILLKRKLAPVKIPKEFRKSEEYLRKENNAIWFLGGFTVYDPQGKDISYRFSKKLKELFILVYFETLKSDGINSMKLSETLWPEMDKNSQKNNRGVTINNLRKVLTDLDGIELVNENSKWKIAIENECFIDYHEVFEVLKKKDFIQHSNFLVTLFSFGNILPNLQFDWLDKYKINYEMEVNSKIYSISNHFFIQKKYLNSFESAQLIHDKFDEIDEMALALKVRALDKLKSIKKAYDEYERYKKRYASFYKEHYKLTYEEVILLAAKLDDE